jgi:hypothetical protein
VTSAAVGSHTHDHAHAHDHPHPHAASTGPGTGPVEDNGFAGKGAVLIDIGDGVGACIINAPAELVGVEIEYKPTDREPELPLKHVAVVARRTPSGKVLPTAVFSALPEGSYAFWERPDGPVKLTVDVVSGEITTLDWPTG